MEHYYQSIPGWFTERDAAFYAWLVSEVPDGGTIVEVGCWMGRSLSCLLVEAKNSGKRLNIHAVDAFQGSVGQLDLIKAAAEVDLENVCREHADRAGYPYSLTRAKSVEAARQFRDCDAVFIDASHDTRSVMADIEAWLPRINPGGILSGHDANEQGVQLALANCLDGWIVPYGTCWYVRIGVPELCAK